VVRVEAWFDIAAEFSIVPLFFRYALIPVARKRCSPIVVATPAADHGVSLGVGWPDFVRLKGLDEFLRNGKVS
jgi:hypothetical protein